MSASSKPQENILITPLNLMVFHPRYQHITEAILKKMDRNTIKNCRQVSKFWLDYIDNQKILWKNEVGSKAFHLACMGGHYKIAKIQYVIMKTLTLYKMNPIL